jgi:hypothetical protein
MTKTVKQLSTLSRTASLAALGLTSAVAMATFDVHEARACSAPLRTVSSRLVLPTNEATDVPRDARAIVHMRIENLSGGYEGVSPAAFVEGGDFALRGPDGEDVPTAVTYVSTASTVTVFLTPLEALEPDTTYSVWDRVCVNCATLYSDEAAEVGVFATGTTVSNGAPAGPGEVTIKQSPQSCDSSACCGPYEAVGVSLGFEAAPADTLVRVEKFSKECDTFKPVGYTTGGYVGGWQSCSGNGYNNGPTFFGGGTYRLVFEGVGPVASEPSAEVVVEIDCDGLLGEPNPPVEGEPVTLPPGNQPNPPVEGEPGAQADDGSGCGGGATPMGFGVLALLGARLLERRKLLNPMS